MASEEDHIDRSPVLIYVLNGKGYVWDADGAFWLRDSCGIVGAMVGGVSAFKQQNAIRGLPLELAPEEVTLARERGWGVLKAPSDALKLAALTAAGSAGKRQRRPWDYDDDDELDHDSDDDVLYSDDVSGEGEHEDAEQTTVKGSDNKSKRPAWQDALARGSHFEIPITLAAADSMQTGVHAECTPAAEWIFPASPAERERYLVFKDLQRRGFRLTGGSKFGADYLIYPGDPTIYHAQFCVRLWPATTPLLPAMFASACRGSFQARKHLLIASVVEKEGSGEESVMYTTAGPMDGFG